MIHVTVHVHNYHIGWHWLTPTMTGLKFIAVLIVLFSSLLYMYTAQSQATETCSTEEMRRATVNEKLIYLGCGDYNCGLLDSALNSYYAPISGMPHLGGDREIKGRGFVLLIIIIMYPIP